MGAAAEVVGVIVFTGEGGKPSAANARCYNSLNRLCGDRLLLAISERSLIFEIKIEIRVKFNSFVNFFAQTNQFSSGSGCQIAKAETENFRTPHIWVFN